MRRVPFGQNVLECLIVGGRIRHRIHRGKGGDAGDQHVAVLGIQPVAATAADEEATRIRSRGAGSAIQDILAAFTQQDIVAGIGVEDIVPLAAANEIVARTAVDSCRSRSHR